MSGTAPTILWLRRDLRLSDHPALSAALAEGGPVIPLFIRDAATDSLGAAPKWRLGEALGVLEEALKAQGSGLVLRSGAALDVLGAVIAETGARSVHWSRLYDPEAIARDTAVKSALRKTGITAESHGGHLLFEPWTVQTGQGGFYRVYTPLWRAVKDREVAAPAPAPGRLPAPEHWPQSEHLADWDLGRAVHRGAAIIGRHAAIGEEAAHRRLAHFTAEIVGGYDTSRDCVAEDGTSRLSAHLALGEIGPRTCWHAGLRAFHDGKPGAETFLKELVWREFAYHLLYHTPHLTSDNWRQAWAAFPWNEDATTPEAVAWTQGR
ncbi:MAG: deoxyribodipyrimidine photo-lyase, partial [Pseudomonadota bacterium]